MRYGFACSAKHKVNLLKYIYVAENGDGTVRPLAIRSCVLIIHRHFHKKLNRLKVLELSKQSLIDLSGL